jgi:hypothetical protein
LRFQPPPLLLRFLFQQIEGSDGRLESRVVQPPELGRIVAIPQVGGLHHRYERRAA